MHIFAMSKRSKSVDVGGEKKIKHWSFGLLESMKDPNAIVQKTENLVVISDKYPKAKIHYLVIPLQDISSIFKLNESHLSLLSEFKGIFEKIEKQHSGFVLHAGFHAVPSMHRLHMHIISKDMVSTCLKTKIHWNSFTTRFFIPFKDLISELKENGSIKRITPEVHESLITTPLQCNQCSFKPKNMPQLKEHLLTHVEK